MVGTPEPDDCKKIVDAHALIGEQKSSWAVTCKRLSKNTIRVHGFQSYKNTASKKKKQKIEIGYIIFKIWRMYT